MACRGGAVGPFVAAGPACSGAEDRLWVAGRVRPDEATARWCFQRLPPPEGDPGWLQERYDGWLASGLPWDAYCRAWAEGEGLHSGQDIVRELDARFDRLVLAYGPYFFADLADVSESQERAAIDAGEIVANRLSYVGQRR